MVNNNLRHELCITIPPGGHQLGLASLTVPVPTTLGLQACGGQSGEKKADEASSATTESGASRKIGIALVGLGQYSEG